MEKKKNQNSPIPYEPFNPAISEESLERIMSWSDDQTRWLRPVPGGFLDRTSGKVVSVITGRIASLGSLLIHFPDAGGPPFKRPDVESELDIPEGFERRVELRVEAGKDQLIGLSLTYSSAKYYLSPYLRFLSNQGLCPEEVLTKFESKQVSNQKGTWSTVVFTMVDQGTTEATPPSENRNQTPPNRPSEWM